MSQQKSKHVLHPLALLALIGIVIGSFLSIYEVKVHAASPGPSFEQVKKTYFQAFHPPTTYLGKARAKQQFPCQTPVNSARCYVPSQITHAYSIDPLYKAGVKGKGQTIIVVNLSQSPTIQQDLHSFNQTFGLPDSDFNIVAPFGTDQAFSSIATEITLDVEWSHAIAPEATIDLLLAKLSPTTKTSSDAYNDYLNAVEYAIDHNLGDAISMSYGFAELCMNSQVLQRAHKLFEAAAAKHITLLNSSGDVGVTMPDSPTLGCGLDAADQFFPYRAIPVPAADPLVTTVGGTFLDANLAGKYKGEIAWSQNSDATNGASGGGFSTIYAKPAYQRDIADIGKFRGEPDVAYNGDSNSGVQIVCSSCDDQSKDTQVFSVGGTSAGAPQWAGIVALGNQLGHHRLGFINPALYRIGKSPFANIAFHDITSGTNTYSFYDVNKKLVTVVGYIAHKGWDPVTGWGTPVASRLVPLLASFARVDDANDL